MAIKTKPYSIDVVRVDFFILIKGVPAALVYQVFNEYGPEKWSMTTMYPYLVRADTNAMYEALSWGDEHKYYSSVDSAAEAIVNYIKQHPAKIVNADNKVVDG